ncbi:ArsR/SmtB family transcription factor [Candidatus Entotheonella palauensis]|uniref:ArsR/SmtB family transcription factor n=1 Tax=Candidatus Entotheonella palauensis TaxID=93172 RepID=UPI00211997D3|nr:metalloregulator ArsR/SmtB family transcription factor [Candidatus Entotheonella palauensis]
MKEGVETASRLLKALANQDRLLLLCYLAEGEHNVSDLEALLQIRQPTLSQQLARLRADNLVETRRQGKEIYYRLASTEASAVIELLHELFCEPRTEIAAQKSKPAARH